MILILFKEYFVKLIDILKLLEELIDKTIHMNATSDSVKITVQGHTSHAESVPQWDL